MTIAAATAVESIAAGVVAVIGAGVAAIAAATATNSASTTTAAAAAIAAIHGRRYHTTARVDLSERNGDGTGR